VCPSVTFMNSVKTNKCIFKTFSLLDSDIILPGSLLMGASNADGVGYSQPISGSIAWCEQFYCQVQYTQMQQTAVSCWH